MPTKTPTKEVELYEFYVTDKSGVKMVWDRLSLQKALNLNKATEGHFNSDKSASPLASYGWRIMKIQP